MQLGRNFKSIFRSLACLLVIAVFAFSANHASAQDDGGTDTIGTGITSGVRVDADGVLRLTNRQISRQLLLQHRQQAFANLNRDAAKKSPLRKVSLTRLEKALQAEIAKGGNATNAMKNLAGLTRIQYVFCYPETGDIVIAGPAEPWGVAPSGRSMGLVTGKPVLELDDLIVALRCFPPSGKKPAFVGCSIDPTQEGLNNMRKTFNKMRRGFRPHQTQQLATALKNSLGLQTISVMGVSPKTHFAQVMVEADYRMKLIGIGLQRPPVKMKSWVDVVNPGSVAKNSLQRWYFVPNYECIKEAENSLAMELIGNGVKLVGEDEVVGEGGVRSQTGSISRASNVFVKGFTAKYPKVAKASPVFAQLRNCIDMLVTFAFIQERDYYGEVGWDAKAFSNEKVVKVETQNVPAQVETAVNAIWRRSTLMTPIGGGVQIQAQKALDDENVMEDKEKAVELKRESIDLKDLKEGQWWWD